MIESPLLSQPHLSVIARSADYELARIQDLIEHKVLIDGRGDFEEGLGRLLADEEIAVRHPKTLDLIGHSSPGQSLLMLGDWLIDARRGAITAFFRELADNNVLPRLGIHSLRLIGCHTAHTEPGRETICVLSDILGLEVHGTRHLIYSAHYDAEGFREDCTHALVCSSDLRRVSDERTPAATGEPYPRILDIDALPATPLAARAHLWPRRVASVETARNILRLVRRTHGATMPGLLAAPDCEVALPSTKPDWYHFAQVLLDGEFLRVYPDGQHGAGVVFPIDDPPELRALLGELPTLR